MDNPKVILDSHWELGKGVFAIRDIKKGEVIAEFDGEIYIAEKTSKLPTHVKDYAIQFAENRYKDSKGIARYINHSCNPNCGIKDLFKVVAMRDIKKDEEVTWDYEMSENSDWKMNCNCENKNCRKIIGAHKYLPKEIKKKYEGYISEWLIKK